MSYEAITVPPSSPHVGAEIGNIDLTRPLSNREVEEVHQALLQYSVIFFRNQKLDFESHTRFARYFGDLAVHAGGDGTASQIIPGHPDIRRQHFDTKSKRGSGADWHTDQSCPEIPPMASILYQPAFHPAAAGYTPFSPFSTPP